MKRSDWSATSFALGLALTFVTWLPATECAASPDFEFRPTFDSREGTDTASTKLTTAHSQKGRLMRRQLRESYCDSPGGILTPDGNCVCNDGFEPEACGHGCRKCDAGQYSRRPRSDAVGSEGCTMCAEHYYRPDPHLPPSACTPCNMTLQGVRCGQNATIFTLSLEAGYWRHSAAALQTWRCARRGSWSPCRGGDHAGSEGEGYCQPGHVGLRCQSCNRTDHSPSYFDHTDAQCHGCSNAVAAAAAAVISSGLIVILCSVGLVPPDTLACQGLIR